MEGKKTITVICGWKIKVIPAHAMPLVVKGLKAFMTASERDSMQLIRIHTSCASL